MLVGIMFCLVGCSSPKPKESIQPTKATENLNTSYTSTMDISYHEIRATATIDQQYPGNYKIKFTQPAVMSGMELETEGQLIRIKYRELSAQFNSDEFFDSSIAKTVISTLNNVTVEEGLEFSLENESLIVSGVGETGKFNLRIDRKNGNLLSLDVPDEELKVEFKDFKFLS